MGLSSSHELQDVLEGVESMSGWMAIEEVIAAIWMVQAYQRRDSKDLSRWADEGN
jgi:hypothetical protein